MNMLRTFYNGIVPENPTLRLVIGMCPVLAVTTAVVNSVWMGLAVIFVLTASNILISLLRKFIPDKIRIPCFIVVIATFTTIADLVLAAVQPDVHKILGVFVPLIVVNCIILGRAEAFASKNPVHLALADGVGMGIGFTLAIMILASIREILGNGSWFGIRFMPAGFEPATVMILPPGAFVSLGFLLGTMNLITARLAARNSRSTERVPSHAADAGLEG
ncbi:MAG: H+/Na+-translocating ferredoxin:NAD+ oxidoreductase subunit [Bacillota bacterium]|jgi:electron transport complex protein RnfE|nr:H+/Na+-translocating ferredoxin:NAD+ oxidoreductase subunit [Bacillota bacterium]